MPSHAHTDDLDLTDAGRWRRRRPRSPSAHASRSARRLLAALAVVALLGAGCVDDDPAAAPPAATGTARADPEADAPSGRRPASGSSGGSGSGGIVLASALRTTASCDALLGELKAEALERVGPHGLGGGWYGPTSTGADRAVEEAGGSGGPAAGTASGAVGAGDGAAEAAGSTVADRGRGDGGQPADLSGPDHSGTTIQESGVDEADIVKTDGRRLVVVDGQRVQVLDVSGAAPVLQRTIELPEDVHGGELFLVGDRALLMTSGWAGVPRPTVSGGEVGGLTMPAGTATSRLLQLDLSAGRVERSLVVAGSYLSAREVGGTVRVVISTPTIGLPFVLPANPAAEEAAEAANRAVIERSTIEQWLPAYRTFDGAGGQTGAGLVVPCESMHLPEEFAGFGSVSVLTVDLDGDLAPEGSVGVLTDGQTVYASTDRLVVATARWVDPVVFDSGDQARLREATESRSTALHTFDITDPTRTAYVASGALAGHLVDQFALDEHHGMIRVATTEGEPWGGGASSESFVTVLREAAGGLELVGRVGGLGPGEQIQSVRFLDDVAYVVTFRQVDPFYVVDLTDPAAPLVTGELKIPGFSSYLHPLGPSLVVGVGQDATEDGRVTGAQLSVFDVTDPADPRRVAQLDLGEDTWSLAGSDHRAFLWWAPERLVVLPVSGSGWSDRDGTSTEQSEGVVLIRVGGAGELAELGRLAHPTLERCDEPVGPMPEPAVGVDGGGDDPVTSRGGVAPSGVSPPVIGPGEPVCWRWQPAITRSLVVRDSLLTVSEGGVQANALADLAPLGYVPFPR